MVCLVVFLISGTAVYYLGQRKLASPRLYTTQAGVAYQLPAVSPSSGEAIGRPFPNLVEVQRQILSDENLTRALNQTEGRASGSQDLLQLRGQIHIADQRSAQRPGIAITYRGYDSMHVRRFVNQLAEQYAVAERARLEAAASRSYQEAHRRAEQARRELQQAMDRLEGALKPPMAAHQLTRVPPAAPNRQETEPPRPLMVDNPEWLELDGQRKALEQRRTQLLIDRTPAHPEVQYVETQIGELREAQARMPRQIPNPSGQVAASLPVAHAPAETLGHVVPSAPPAEDRQVAQERAALRGAVDRTKQRVGQLVQAEREAWERMQATPQVHVQLADRCLATGGTVRVSLQWLVIAVSVGLALAILAGLFSARLRRDRPVVELAELQTLVPVPIVGVVTVAERGCSRPCARTAF